MGKLIDGKAIADKIHDETTQKVTKLKARGITPFLGVVLVGDNAASQMYDRMKGSAAERAGIKFLLHKLPATITAVALVQEIHTIQRQNKLTGLIIQLPLPEHLYTPSVLNAIDPKIDVDFLTDTNMGKLIMNTSKLLPPTPGAVIAILKELKIDMSGKNITIVGMGSLVGKPLSIMMVNGGASVTTVNSRTQNVSTKCLGADILISGVGKKDLIRGDMLKPGAIVIDAGICFENHKVFGDVNVAEALEVASLVTPTPGGVGPITVALLLHNTVACAEKLNS